MKQWLSDWFNRLFAQEEVVVFVLLAVVFITAIVLVGPMLAPAFIALILAYLLQSVVAALERAGARHLPAVIGVFLAFVGLVITMIVVVMPLAWQQLVNLLGTDLPNVLGELRGQLLALPEQYPQLFSESQMEAFVSSITQDVGLQGQRLITSTLASLPSVVAVLVYLVLVPVLIFFMLKDREALVASIVAFLPRRRTMMNRVWAEMNRQMMNYVRGKVIEIVVVGMATVVTFYFMGLRYAMLLGIMVGLSVVIPYIGAAIVTIPVAMVAYFQFGATSDFMWVIVAYGIIQAIDGNILVPWLFSEAVNLHPVSIIIAVLLFGGLWGIWGVFFAIPLATLVKAVYNAWPRTSDALVPTPPISKPTEGSPE